MSQPIHTLHLQDDLFPEMLRHIPKPPEQVYVHGEGFEETMARPRLAIVGSRKVSAYGRVVTDKLAREATSLGITIVSGLAFGVDAIAHRAALEVGGQTMAVLACGVDRVYPASHQRLGDAIVERGGTLISEYAPGTTPYKDHFIARNRIVAGLSHGVLITEAAQKSGSLHTARFALEQGREVLAVPGNITSETSVGTNNLIKSGATPVTGIEDILQALGWEYLATSLHAPPVKGDTPAEQAVLDLLAAGTTDGSELVMKSNLPIDLFNQTLTMLEITGKAHPLGGNRWALRHI